MTRPKKPPPAQAAAAHQTIVACVAAQQDALVAAVDARFEAWAAKEKEAQKAKEESERLAAEKEKEKKKKKPVRYPTEDLDVVLGDKEKKAGMGMITDPEAAYDARRVKVVV